MILYTSTLRAIVSRLPAVVPHLTPRARLLAGVRVVPETKTQDAYYRQIWGLTLDLYRDEISQDAFIDGMAVVVQEQLTRAFREALRQNDMDPELVNDYGEGYGDELMTMILREFEFVDGYAADIVAARAAGSGFEQFQTRAAIWANRYAEAVNRANELIAEANGNNLMWVYGDTEHCETCQALNGIVAPASTWMQLSIHPQEPPNDILECGGWRCQCRLEPTDKRSSPKAFDTIMNIVTR